MNEALIEQAALAWLAELGFATIAGPTIGPDGGRPERAAYGDVVLAGRLRDAIARLNPALDADARAAVLAKVLQAETPFLIEENRTFDKRPQVNQAAIVENKRLGPVLAYIAQKQKELDMSRSAKAPRRRGQANHMFKVG